MEYIAHMRKIDSAHYEITFQDFPNCKLTARTAGEARNIATRALAQQIAILTKCGAEVPMPISLDDLAVNDLPAGTVVLMVPGAPVEETVLVNITARASQIEEIDRLAKLSGMNRSCFMVQNAIRHGGLTLARAATNVP